MRESKTMEDIHKGLLKKFHTLCSALTLSDDEKHAMIGAYGVESSRDLNQHQLIDLCAALSQRASPKDLKELDRLRKQCIAAIGKWLTISGRKNELGIIKRIACRAAHHSDFNRIPRERLRNLVYLFNHKSADAEAVEELTREKYMI